MEWRRTGRNLSSATAATKRLICSFAFFVVPQIDNVLICPPTYGMYEVSAEINDVKIRRANLTVDFQLDFRANKTCD
jgi:histidinol-phosphate aminotransferase